MASSTNPMDTYDSISSSARRRSGGTPPTGAAAGAGWATRPVVTVGAATARASSRSKPWAAASGSSSSMNWPPISPAGASSSSAKAGSGSGSGATGSMSSNSSISSGSWAGSSIVISTPTSGAGAGGRGRGRDGAGRRGRGRGRGRRGRHGRGQGRSERGGLGVERRGLAGISLEPVDLGHHAQALQPRARCSPFSRWRSTSSCRASRLSGKRPSTASNWSLALSPRPYLRKTRPSARCSLMNSSSSADSGPLSSMPAGPPARSRGLEAHGQGGNRRPLEVHLEAARGLASLLLAEPAELRSVLVVVRLELHQHLEDRGGLVEAPRREVRLDHRRVGLRHQRVVARLAVELDQLAQAADVGGVALDDLLEDPGAAVDLAALHELVHGRQDLLEGLVVAPLGEVHVPELQARVLVRGVSLEQGLEDLPGVVRPLRAEAGLREPERHVAVGGGGPPRLLEVLDRAGEVLLDEVDAGRGREQTRAARPRAQGLLDELERLGQVALLDQLLGDGHVLVGGLLQVAVARVELRQADADLHVRGVDLGHATQDVARVA